MRPLVALGPSTAKGRWRILVVVMCWLGTLSAESVYDRLNAAVDSGDAALVVGLVAKESSERRPELLNYAMFAAILKENRPLIKELLRRGVDVNARHTRDEKTNLMVAAGRGDYRTVKLLVKQGADVRAVDTDGHDAAYYGHKTLGSRHTQAGAVIKYLVKRGAKDPRPPSPAQAGSRGSAETVEGQRLNALLEGIDTATTPRARERLMHAAMRAAAGQGKRRVIRKLLAAGAGVEAVESQSGKTALMSAVQEHELRTVKFLVRRGADPNAVDGKGRNAVYYAYRGKDPAIALYLIDAGATDMRPQGVASAAEAFRGQWAASRSGALQNALLYFVIGFMLTLPFLVVPTIVSRLGQLRYLRTGGYQRTAGRITTSLVRAKMRRWHRWSQPVVAYSYAVGERTFEGRVKIAAFGGLGAAVAWDMAALFPKGKSVTVLYDPDCPGESVLDKKEFPPQFYTPPRWSAASVKSALLAGAILAFTMLLVGLHE